MSVTQDLRLRIGKETLGICRLDGQAAVPDWVQGSFVSVTRTAGELSIVCPQEYIPASVPCEGDWRYLVIEGSLDFSLVGVLASISGALARKGISVFVISTYDTDYILVKEPALAKAVEALVEEGHRVIPA
ncbi:MAG TPA: ACT domain-containing protein [Clostridia bacterium]|nr:ACT domain-containing protein [Clostridia bacterium]